MHCLETIIARNGYAAGRELGHAVADGEPIFAASIDTGRGWTAPQDPAALRAFCEGSEVGEAESKPTLSCWELALTYGEEN